EFHYKNKNYYVTTGESQLTTVKGLSNTSVSLLEGMTKLLVSVETATLAKDLKHELFSYVTSPKYDLSRDEKLSITCTGMTERELLIRTSNNTELLIEKKFGSIGL